ncbi:MAG: putative protein YjdF [Chlamydiia bacterium]|nr:putative protein YjdF [Chlamydiia bacterium]
MITIKATILLEKGLWMALFERTDKEGYAVARHIFGNEPTDPEVYEFVHNNYLELKFGKPQEFDLQIKRVNPKRLQRQVRKEVEKAKKSTKPSTHAQDYMREELELKKKEKKKKKGADKRARDDEQFSLRQEKKKKKHKGH